MTFIENRSSILSPYQRYVVYIYMWMSLTRINFLRLRLIDVISNCATLTTTVLFVLGCHRWQKGVFCF